MADAWPEGVPQTLWSQLQSQTVPSVPMMGVSPDPAFLLVAAGGALFLVFFARDRFINQAGAAAEAGYKILTELKVRDLGGHTALRRAYLIYAFVLLIVYAATTFFGSLLASLTNRLPVAGIEVDVSSIPFDDPIWPLTVAFGLAGLGPLLPPLRIAEDWMRARAYRLVGIPTRIQKTSGNLIAELNRAGLVRRAQPDGVLRGYDPFDDRDRADGQGAESDGQAELRNFLLAQEKAVETDLANTWIADLLGEADEPGDTRAEFVALMAQLRSLRFWARRGRGAWPGVEVSESVRDLEQKLLDEADALLGDFHQRAKEAKMPQRGVANQAQEQRRLRYIRDIMPKMRRLRGEMAAVMAVFVERDPVRAVPAARGGAASSGEGDGAGPSGGSPGQGGGAVGGEAVSEIPDPALNQLLRASYRTPVTAGPESSLIFAILCLMPVYVFFTWRGWHPPFAPEADPSQPATLIATAALEAARQCAILWLPVVAAFSVRQYLVEEERWVYAVRQGTLLALRPRVAAIVVGMIVAFLALVGLALLWAFLQATSEARFNELLIKGVQPFLVFYPTMFFISVPVTLGALWGADARARHAPREAVLAGVVSAALTMLALAWHMGEWYEYSACAENGRYLRDIFQQDGGERSCLMNYGGLDFLAYGLLAFLTAAFFGSPENSTPGEQRRASLNSLSTAGRGGPAAAGLVAVILLIGWASAGQAADRCPDDGGAGRADASAPCQVILGMRKDAEPFSFRADPASPASHGLVYSGYAAEICRHIFAGPNYEISEREVTAEDRFRLLREGEVDVLCDPVTLRLNDPERDGLYSPMIFASGVSYLRVLQRARGARAQIAYVEDTTAEAVARRACEVDLLNIVAPADRGDLPIICALSWSVSKWVFWRGELPSEKRDKRLRAAHSGLLQAVIDQRRRSFIELDDRTEDLCRDGGAPCRRERDEFIRCITDNDCDKADDVIVAALVRLSLPECARAAGETPGDCSANAKSLAQVLAQPCSGDCLVDRNRLLTAEGRRATFERLDRAAKSPLHWARIEKQLRRWCPARICDQQLALADLEKVDESLIYLGFGPKSCDLRDSERSSPNEQIFYRFCPQTGHERAIAWLCSRRFDVQSNLTYMGDRDIIVGKLRGWEKAHGSCGVVDPQGAESLTYEPYALLLRKQAWLAEAVQRGVYDFFSRRSQALGTFGAYFPGMTMSTPLAHLFLLNAVTEEEEVTMRPVSDPVAVVRPDLPVP